MDPKAGQRVAAAVLEDRGRLSPADCRVCAILAWAGCLQWLLQALLADTLHSWQDDDYHDAVCCF